jgi:hypothetical protein
MEKSKAEECLENCFYKHEQFSKPEIIKALVLKDEQVLESYRKKYYAIMAKKQMYIDQVNTAKTNDEIMKIIGSVNLSDVVN